jgi:hypothetical protein
MNKAQFQVITEILKTSSSAVFGDNGALYAEIKGEDLNKLSLDQLHNFDFFEVIQNGKSIDDFSNLQNDKTYNIELNKLSFKDYYIYKSVEDFFSRDNVLQLQPKGLYFQKERRLCFASNIEAEHDLQIIKNYFSVLKFVDFLRSISEFPFEESADTKLFFVEKSKLIISLNICIDINKLKLSTINKFNQQSYETDDKRKLFKSSLIEFVGKRSSDEALNYIIANFKSLIALFDNNYHLFLMDYSLEEEKNKFQQIKQGHLENINTAISSVHVRALTIPAAFLIFANQIKAKDLYVSTIVFICAILYCVIINKSLQFYQKELLEHYQAVYQKKCYLKTKQRFLFQAFSKEINRLLEKCKFAQQTIQCFSIINYIAAFLYFALTIYCNWDIVFTLFHQIIDFCFSISNFFSRSNFFSS